MHAIILAGGFGTRLQSVVSDVPKPLAPVAGRPFLGWLTEALVTQGITGITLSVHHQWEKIRDYFDRSPLIVPLDFAVEEKPLGTGGAMIFALKQAPKDEPVLILNGDTFVRVDYRALQRHHIVHESPLTMALRQVPDTGRYGEVVVDGGAVSEFTSGQNGKPGLINAGIYLMKPDLFADYDLPEAFSFERDFLPQHVAKIRPNAYVADDYFIDIGIPEDYARAQVEIPNILRTANG